MVSVSQTISVHDKRANFEPHLNRSPESAIVGKPLQKLAITPFVTF